MLLTEFAAGPESCALRMAEVEESLQFRRDFGIADFARLDHRVAGIQFLFVIFREFIA